MFDLELAAALFRSIDWQHIRRLILVGDAGRVPAHWTRTRLRGRDQMDGERPPGEASAAETQPAPIAEQGAGRGYSDRRALGALPHRR